MTVPVVAPVTVEDRIAYAAVIRQALRDIEEYRAALKREGYTVTITDWAGAGEMLTADIEKVVTEVIKL